MTSGSTWTHLIVTSRALVDEREEGIPLAGIAAEAAPPRKGVRRRDGRGGAGRGSGGPRPRVYRAPSGHAGTMARWERRSRATRATRRADGRRASWNARPASATGDWTSLTRPRVP